MMGASSSWVHRVRIVRWFVTAPMALAVVLAQHAPTRRNTIVFVADNLRHGSVNPIDTPVLHRIRTQGVHFANSHAVFPAQTMPNSAAIATGHWTVLLFQIAQRRVYLPEACFTKAGSCD